MSRSRMLGWSLMVLVLASPAWAATLKQQVIGAVNVGVPATIELTVTGGKVSGPVALPTVAGLTLNGSGTNPQPRLESFTFFVTSTHAGDFTIPAFDLHTDTGETLHVAPITLYAVP
jgi:hypothetical protein